MINEREAAIVRRIYAEYASGMGSLAIVRGLNREGEPGPSGGAWNVPALVGSPKKRNGLLNNELYHGVIVYNRQRFLKDPATGKRVSRLNPESEWLRQETPELRIVDGQLWQAAQRLRESRGGTRPHEKRRPQRLLSGLIYCGGCGARYNIATKDWLRCSARTNSGTCLDSRPVRMAEVEQRVLTAVERHLLAPEMVEAALTAYREELARAQDDRDSMRGRLEAELAEVERKSARLLRLVEDGHADPAVVGPRLNELSAKKRQLVAELASSPEDASSPAVDDGGSAYRDLVRNLRLELGEGREGTGEASGMVRGLVRRIVIQPREDGEFQPIEVEAGYSGIMQSPDHDCIGGCGDRI